MTLSIYGNEIHVPEEISRLYHEDQSFKNDFDIMMRKVIDSAKLRGCKRTDLLFNNDPDNVIDVN